MNVIPTAAAHFQIVFQQSYMWAWHLPVFVLLHARHHVIHLTGIIFTHHVFQGMEGVEEEVIHQLVPLYRPIHP